MTASISDFNDRQAPGELGCAACGARLAHDQRYCVQCGERRGPLPPHVAEAIAARFELGDEPVRLPAPSADQSRPRVAPRPAVSWFPSTRVAAIAVLGMLAFGVAVGSAVGGGVTSLASAPLLILAQQSQPALAPTSSAAGSDSSGGAGDSGGSGSQTVQTVTVTSTGAQPQSSTPASSNSGAGTNTTSGGNGGSTNALGLPPIKHVFLIVLSGRGYSQTFEPGSPDTYLSKTLPAQGEVLPDYYAVTAGSLANEIALISGQGPTLQTAANCPVFTNLVPGSVGQHGQALGAGCVYPPAVQTLADQLSTAGLRWKAYIQGLPPGAADGCRHPAIGAADAQPPTLDKPYATWRNPFVYFQSLTAGTSCTKDEVELSQLGLDLQAAKTTPAFSYIVADPCNDGGDAQCGPAPGSAAATASTTTAPTSTTTTATTATTTSSAAPGSTTATSATTPSSSGATEPTGLAASDNFLKSVLPEIESSEAYKTDGLIAITFDQAPQSGPYADSSSCCSNPTFPNLPSGSATTTPGSASDPATGAQTPTTTTTATETTTVPTSSTASSTTTSAADTTASTTTPVAGTTTSTTTPASPPASTGTGESSPTGGGGQVGMLLLSRYVKPRTVNVTAYFNHFSLLKTVEAIFGLKYLGYAGVLEVPPFDSSVFNAAP